MGAVSAGLATVGVLLAIFSLAGGVKNTVADPNPEQQSWTERLTRKTIDSGIGIAKDAGNEVLRQLKDPDNQKAVRNGAKGAVEVTVTTGKSLAQGIGDAIEGYTKPEAAPHPARQ